MVARFDPDGDGVIKLDEMDERMRMGATFMLQRMGVDTEQPIKVDEVRSASSNRLPNADRAIRGAARGSSRSNPPREAYRVTGADKLNTCLQI